MANISLKKIYEGNNSLNEELQEPSDQMIKDFQKILKIKTGITTAVTLDTKLSSKDEFIYSVDLSNNINNAVLNAAFKSIKLFTRVTSIPNSLNGLLFNTYIIVYVNNRHNDADRIELQDFRYINNKFL